jgi:hypothetical protein
MADTHPSTSQSTGEIEPRYFIKFQSVTGGVQTCSFDSSIYVKYLPCLVGRESSLYFSQ